LTRIHVPIQVIRTTRTGTSGAFTVTHTNANTCNSVAIKHFVNIVKYLECLANVYSTIVVLTSKFGYIFTVCCTLCNRGHPYKFTKAFCSTRPSCHSQFFNQRIVNVWNSLPHTVDFTTLTSFKRTTAYIDFSDFLKVFSF